MRYLTRFWQRHEYLSIGLLWAAIVIVVFWEPLTSGPDRVLGGNDVSYLFLPWLRFSVESVKNGIFPLWNPYVFGGVPFVGNPQPALFYPATWLALWLGPERAIGSSIALHTWIAALGMHGWLRAIGATRSGAFFASIAYALSGFMTARIWAGHYGVVMGAAWLPAALWAVTHALNRRSIAWAIIAGLPFGLMFLTGHTPTFALLALGLIAFAGFEAIRAARQARSVRSALASLGLLGLAGIVGLTLAAVQALPTLTLVQNSARAATRSLDFASGFSLPPDHLLSMLVPDLFGEPVHTGYWGVPVFEEYIYYVGVPTLILAALSVFTRDKRARFFVAFGAFGLIAALGPAGVVYRFIPFFDLFRAPARAAMWSMPALSAAAGLCVSALQSSSADDARRVLAKWPRPLIALGSILGFAGAIVAITRFAQSPAAPEAGRLRDLSGDILVFVVLFIGTSILLRLWSRRPHRSRRWLLLITALLLTDLSAYHANLVQMAPSIRGAPYAAAERFLGDRLKDSRLIWVYADLFQLNLGMDFGQRNVYGYDSLIPARLQTLIDHAGDLTTPIYDLLNVRYVISQSPLSERVEFLGEGDGHFFYERPNAAPRAWIVHALEPVANDEAALDRIAADFDPQSLAIVIGGAPCAVEPQAGADSVSITRYEPNRIEARVDAGAAGVLVFSEIEYPGWAAAIDGAPATIQRVDYGLRSVCLPRGSHTVSLVYDPPELKAGAILSLTGLAVIALAGVAEILRSQRSLTPCPALRAGGAPGGMTV